MSLPRGSHRLAFALVAIATAACSKSEKSIADTTSTPIAPVTTTSAGGGTVAGGSSIALADVAGTWKVVSTPTTGADKTPTKYTLTATGEAGGWKIVFANGLTQTPRVTTSGDSIVYDMGPYSSVRRKGVQVTTHGVMRKEGDKLVGTVVAHYAGAGADSVLTLHAVATKEK